MTDGSIDTYPGTGIADVEVIPPLLGRELGTALPRDPVAERADLALELARRVAGLDPVGYLAGAGLFRVSRSLGSGSGR